MKGQILITRPNSNAEDEYIEITLTCKSSLTEFVEIKMSLADFTRAITSQVTTCEFSVRKLEQVGKKRLSKPLIFEIPAEHAYSCTKYAEENYEKFKDDGWIASSYFGSQSSFKRKGDKTFAQGVQYKYVSLEEAENYKESDT